MPAHPVILLVDDEAPLLRSLRVELETAGYRVVVASSGQAALPLLAQERPSLVVLDLIMPGMDGIETLRRLRSASAVPVIVLTARDADADKIGALNLGADDYLTKPFNPEELLARIRAVLRRTAPSTPSHEAIVLGNIVIDPARHVVTVAGRTVALSPTEWQLLVQLASHPERVLPHDELLSRTWGPEYRNELQYLRVWISRLRRKLEDNPQRPRYIRTVSGVGYIFQPSADLRAQTAG